MKILVTGSNGLLGQKLVDLLCARKDIHVIATARGKGASSGREEFLTLDITDQHQVDTVIESTRPDVLINTAAMTQVDQCETEQEACLLNNVTAVGYLLAACEQYGVRLIQLSTDFIFDGTRGPLDEKATPNPVNLYGESKLRAELLIAKTSIPSCILRTVLVYGVTPDMSRSNIVLWVRKSLVDGKTIRVVNDQWRTPTLAEDLAMGCFLAALKNASGVYNISGKDMLTPYDMAVQTAEAFGLDASLIQVTDSKKFSQPARRPPRTGFDITKARRELGYEPHTFRQGLEIVKTQIGNP